MTEMEPTSARSSHNVAEGLSAHQVLQVGTSGAIYVEQPRTVAHAPEPPHMLPGGIGRIVGRHHLLSEMDEALTGPGSRCCMLWGLAGSGKTTLALAWASSRIADYPDGQFFVDMCAYSGTPRIEARDALRSFLATLGINRSDLPHNEAEWGGIFRAVTAGRRCLVIVDNVGSYEQVRDLVPGLGSVLVVTSRRAIPEMSVRHDARVLKLPLLTLDEGVELIAERVGFVRADREEAAAKRIVQLLEGHPLALAIVSAKLAIQTSWTISDAARGIEEEHSPLRFLDDAGLGIEVGRVISWSLDDLDDATTRVLYVASMLPSNECPVAVLALVLDQPKRDCDRRLRTLCLASLIDEISPGRYRFHDIMKAYLAETLAQALGDEEQERVARRVRAVYLALSYAADRAIDPHRSPLSLDRELRTITSTTSFTVPQALAWFESITPAMSYLTETARADGDFTFVTRFAWSVNTFLYWRQDVTRTLAIQREAVAAAVAGDPAMEALSRRGLGRALADVEQLESAKEQLRASMALDEAAGDLSGLASSQHAMAELALRSGDHRDALRWGLRAARESRASDNVVREARGLYDAARALTAAGHHSWARALGLRSLAMCEERSNDYGRALALRLLGATGLASGDLAEGCTWLERAWRVEESLGNFRSVRTILGQLEQAYGQSGDTSGVEEVRRALARLEHYPDLTQSSRVVGTPAP
ncbi:NB-ARC domain-containing protein [Micromonospora sp. WMMD1120]|uniref:NB-ARC domain-containing protein n=1 Tax=Micromonospora sp. WMMD1120 TaxID=3016106 RepID=UPI002417AA91|nr:NB-ARC domain-containing protein [Micromonospora sp. WMMD1120]MDG4809272.1 NB-ARC domain-containing protein [Micromonospora sp. WMMD1120]